MINSNKISLIIFVLCFYSSSFSQYTFEKFYGGNNYEEANAAVQTDDSGFIAVGYTESFGAGNRDFYVIRTNSYGDTIWTKTFGGPAYDVACEIIKVDNSHYLIGGCVHSFGAGEGDFYLIKINDDGNELWAKTIGTEDNEYLYKVRMTSDGGFIMCGYTEDFFEYKYYIVKTDGQGDTLWTKAYDYGRAHWIEQTNDGGYILMVYQDAIPIIQYGFYLVKLDENGNIMWTKSYASELTWVIGYAVQQTTDGGYIMAGRVDDYGAGGSDFFIIKTNSDGDSLWSRTYGGTSDERAFTLIKTSDGGYLVGGYTATFGAGFFDVYLVKIDPNGDSLWTRTYGTDWQEMAYDIKETSDGGYIVAGYTQHGLFDAYLLKTNQYGLITGLNDSESPVVEDFELLQNYPNPFNPNTVISYQLPVSSSVTLKVYDVLGDEIATLVDEYKTAGSFEVEFNPAAGNRNLASGIYFYQLRAGNFIKTKKMLLLK
ncbi:MAG: T9SS type A sorting domain-containing protein [bacterium]|nr:T9SS type A sorting domain-containing protein [bacterium]